jgi:site-specific DNA recombinase
MFTYALYSRKSDERREITEKSIQDQMTACDEIAVRDQLEVPFRFEESKSASAPGVRPEYNKMIQLIEKGVVTAILCWKVNRLVRNMEEGGKLIQLLVDGKLKEIRTPNAIYRTKDSIYPIVLEAANSAQFSITLKEDVERGLNSHIAMGGWNSKAHQGYRNTRHPDYPKIGVVVPDEKRFPIIRQGWDMMLTGAYTPWQVIQTLNTKWGYRSRKTDKAGGKPLCRSFAYTLFSNPFYAGFVVYKGEVQQGNHIPMVTVEEFNRVQAYLRKSTKQARHHREFAFTGLMRCKRCNQQITAEFRRVKGGNALTTYRCSDTWSRCTKCGMREGSIEKYLSEALERVTLPDELAKAALENILRTINGRVQASIAAAEQQRRTLADVEQRMARLERMWIDELLTDEERYKKLMAQLTREKGEIILHTQSADDEVLRMRDTAERVFTFTVFCADEFRRAEPARKREIATTLTSAFWFDGIERSLTLEIRPLIRAAVEYAQSIAPSKSSMFVPHKISSGSQNTLRKNVVVVGGRSAETVFEPPTRLMELLRTENFPSLQFRKASLPEGDILPKGTWGDDRTDLTSLNSIHDAE